MLRTVLPAALGLTVAVALTGCGAVTPMPTPTPSPTYAVTGDGVLRIGTLVPTGSSIGAAQIAGVETAVREINEAGGVNGAPVQVFHRNSGDATGDIAAAAYAELVAKGADVVIGPSTSDLIDTLLAPAVAARVPIISPAATQPAVSTLDDEGLVFRTVGSYASQAAVLGAELADAKATKVAYLYLDDESNAALLESLTAAVDEQGLTLAYSGSYTASATSFSSVISKIKKAKPDAVVLAAPASSLEQTSSLITALDAAALAGPKLWLTSSAVGDYSTSLAEGVLEGSHGLVDGARPDEAFAARLRQADPSLATYRYAAEAYDATILAALAATQAGDDGGPAIARLLSTVSSTGITCTSYGHCLDVLSTEPDINYDGISGPVDINAAGDVLAGSWTLYEYAAGNVSTPVRSVIGG